MSQKRVSVRLVAEGGRQVKAEFQGIGDAGENNFKRIERQADITGAVVRRVMGVLGAAISTRQLVAYADQWSTPASSKPAQPTSSICCRRGRLSPKCSPTTASCGPKCEVAECDARFSE